MRGLIGLIVVPYVMELMSKQSILVVIRRHLRPTSVEVFVQTFHEASFTCTPACGDKLVHRMHDIERVRPHVSLGPASILSSPCATLIASFHEPSGVIEDSERRRHRAIEEECCVFGVVEVQGDDGYGIVVVWDGCQVETTERRSKSLQA